MNNSYKTVNRGVDCGFQRVKKAVCGRQAGTGRDGDANVL